jgi:hypothetical protein
MAKDKTVKSINLFLCPLFLSIHSPSLYKDLIFLAPDKMILGLAIGVPGGEMVIKTI